MSRLPRPHIPLVVRCRVAARQLGWTDPDTLLRLHRPDPRAAAGEAGHGRLLKKLLAELAGKFACAAAELRLDHNPALVLRERKRGKYIPDANDPEFLIYRTVHDHHLKTNIRGDGALRSDTAERMHQRRMDENRGKRKRRPKAKIQSRGFQKGPKRPWPSRPFGRKA